MERQLKLTVIIVSYNTSKLTIQAIESVLTCEQAKVIVVDNHSSDDSVAAIKKHFGAKIQIIENRENVGFAGANNQGVAKAATPFVMLLNSDAIVQAGALDILIHDLEDNEKLGIVAAALQNTDGSYQPQGGALPTLGNIAAWWLWPLPGEFPGIKPYQSSSQPHLSGLAESSTRIPPHYGEDARSIDKWIRQMGWVGGTALVMRKTEYTRLGGLDEGIFMYAEDIDLCERAHALGLGVAIDPRAKVVHLGSASGSSHKALLGEIKGLLYIFKKSRSPLKVLCLRLVLIKGSLLRLLLFGILGNSKQARDLYGQAFLVSLK